MSATILRALALVVAVMGGLSTSPVSAFDGLERFLRTAPALDLAKPGALLSYARLKETMASGVVAVDIGDVANGYRFESEFRDLFGVDVAALRDQAIVGEPPNVLAFLSLDRARTGDLKAALRKRGFERTMVGANEVYASGADYSVDILKSNPADPFGGGLGVSQRFLVRDDIVIVGRGWPDIRAAAAALDGTRPAVTTLLAATIPVLRDAVGPEAVAGQAVLYGVPTFAGASLDRESIEAIAAGRMPRLPSGGGMPPFAAAWLVAGTQGANAFAAIAAYYGDQESARLGATEIARRLKEFRPGDGPAPSYEVKVASAGSAWAGVVIARFSGQPLASAASTLQRWQGAVMERAFTPLDPLR